MKMEKMPEVTKTSDGAYWKNTYEKFEAQVYVPKSPLMGDILNYGFMAPYLLVFADKKLSYEELVAFARQKGYEKLAADYDTSVVFISPVVEGSGQPCSWKEAAPDILSEIITNSRIHQYHKDGVVIANNFFRHSIDGYYIRGAIFRAILCGFGSGADYIAENCLHHFEGDGLWGRSDLAPAACILTGLTAAPEVGADDIPLVSYGNSEEANELFETMGISQVKDHLPSQCSGGEQQRCAIIRAVISQPSVLFADEPTGALNRRNTIEVLDLITRLNQNGQSVFMVTHDIRAAVRATRLIYIEDGSISGEMTMPPFETEKEKSREAQVNSWLSSMQW